MGAMTSDELAELCRDNPGLPVYLCITDDEGETLQCSITGARVSSFVGPHDKRSAVLIEATLEHHKGAGACVRTCHFLSVPGSFRTDYRSVGLVCDKCGKMCPRGFAGDEVPQYCPHCGRRVVEP
jgi:hypothetical protein